MGRSPCCDENGLKKGPWTPEEDEKLIKYIQKHGHGSWRALPKLAGLNRCGKSCRLRWTNYLRPDIKRGKFSPEEEQTILNLHSVLGNKWSAIATHLPGRTDNEIKNFWNTHLKKKLIQMGFDPMTHRPRTDFLATLPQLIALANLRELINQNPSCWDEHASRIQAAEAARLQYLQYVLQSSTTNSPASTTFTSTDFNAMSLLNSQALMVPSTSATATAAATGSNITSTTSSASALNDLTQMLQLQDFHLIPSLGEESFEEQQQQQQHVSNEKNNEGSNFMAFDHGGDYNNNMNSSSRAAAPWVSTPSSLPPLTDISVSNPGDACSTASCGAGATPSVWPDLLLEDSFIVDF